MPVLRRCLTCRALTAAGSYCVAHKKPGRGGSTRRWRTVRDAVLRRDDHRCASCGAGRSLEVHHRVPVARGGSDRAANLVSLRHACHARTQAGYGGAQTT